MTQNEAILDYIKKHGGITPLEAMQYLGIMRLASRIHDLKKLGFEIADEMVTSNNGRRFKVYRLA